MSSRSHTPVLLLPLALALGCGPSDEPVPATGDLWLPEPATYVSRTAAFHVQVDTLREVLSVSDARRTAEGWALLDGRARQVHMLSDHGEVLTFAREGEGPGELRLPGALAVTGSRVAVAEASGRRASFFTLEGELVGDVQMWHPSCPFGTLTQLVEGWEGSVLALLTCTGLDRSLQAVVLELRPGEPPREVTQRQIQVVTGDVDPFRAPVLGLREGAAFLGILPDPCLERVWPDSGQGGTHRRICSSSKRGPPLPDSLRARLAAVAERLRTSGVSLPVPEALPPFLEVTSASPRLGFLIALEDGTEALDVLEADGQVTRVALPGDARAFLAPDGLLLVRDLLAGSELTRLVFR